MLVKLLLALTTTPPPGGLQLPCDDSTQTHPPSPWIGHAEHGRHVFSASTSGVQVSFPTRLPLPIWYLYHSHARGCLRHVFLLRLKYHADNFAR